jgi:prevent-host-death family protein
MKGQWSIAEARKHFAKLLSSTVKEPQPIYKRGTMVAAVIDAKTYQEFLNWKEERTSRSVAQALDELRIICREENYQLALPKRKDRPNIFAEESTKKSK